MKQTDNCPLLSVVIPAFNAETCIEAAMLSVLRQPLDVELIVVNDGSNDATSFIAHNLAQQYSGVRVVDTENLGAGRARNVGMALATGEFVSFLDSDDLYMPQAFDSGAREWLAGLLGAGVDIVYTPYTRTNFELTERPIFGYPEVAGRVRHHMPCRPFFVCIYRREFLVSQNVQFFEFAAQDVESAFRYRAFSQARKIEHVRSWRFSLQRDNLNSNTHTWNLERLYTTKALVYDQLFSEAMAKEQCQRDLMMLDSVRIEMLESYFDLVKEEGTSLADGQEVYDSMFRLAEAREPLPPELRRGYSPRERIKYSARYRKVARLAESFGPLETHRSMHCAKATPMEAVATNAVMERLQKYGAPTYGSQL